MNEMVLKQQEILTKLQQNYDVTDKSENTKADNDVTVKNSQELGEIVYSVKNTKDSIEQFKFVLYYLNFYMFLLFFLLISDLKLS